MGYWYCTKTYKTNNLWIKELKLQMNKFIENKNDKLMNIKVFLIFLFWLYLCFWIFNVFEYLNY